MLFNYQKDSAALSIGLDRIDSVSELYKNSSIEIKNLLKNECTIIFECCFCRSFFRNGSKFIAHKKSICRSLQQTVQKLNELDCFKTNKSRQNPNSLFRVTQNAKSNFLDLKTSKAVARASRHSKTLLSKEKLLTHENSEKPNLSFSLLSKRIKLSDETNEKDQKNLSNIFNSEKIQKIVIENETQQVAKKTNTYVLRQHEQRKRKPTKRFYSEEYIADSTKHKRRSFSPIDKVVKKNSYKSQENMSQDDFFTPINNNQIFNVSAPLNKTMALETKKKRGRKPKKVKTEIFKTVNNTSIKSPSKNSPVKPMSKLSENGSSEHSNKNSNSNKTLLNSTQSNDDFVLPSLDKIQSSSKSQSSSVVDSSFLETLALYTPRTRQALIEEYSVSTDISPTKQNLLALKSLVASEAINKLPPPRPEDLTEVPVFLTEIQRDLFFAPLRPLLDGLYQCSECSEILRCIQDGRHHMVSHLRIMRLQCSLCNAGAFFCSDMRIHLMFRHCDKLNLAPEGFVAPGNIVPCMDKKKADQLSLLVDPFNPGCVMYTSEKIISRANPKAYLPDPRIEERILGKAFLPLSKNISCLVKNTQSSTIK